MQFPSPASDGRSRKHRRASSKHGPRLQAEPLEDRLMLTGTGLDPSFGSGGTVNLPTDSGLLKPAFAPLPDGKVMVAEIQGTPASYRVELLRFNEDGTLDSSFGTGGIVDPPLPQINGPLTHNGSFPAGIGEIVADTNGKLTMLADASNYGGAFLARFNPDGSIDPSFNPDGSNIGSQYGLAFDAEHDLVTVSQDGKSLVRLLPNGQIDSSFGDQGVVQTTFEDHGPIGVLSNGDLVVQTLATILDDAGSPQFGVAEFDRAGNLLRTASFTGGLATFYGLLLVTPDDKILVMGNDSNDSGQTNFGILREFNADLTPNTAFGQDGVQVAPQYDIILGVDGKLIGGIGTRIAGTSNYNLSFFQLNADGSPDLNFGQNGTSEVPIDFKQTSLQTLTTDGKLLFAGVDATTGNAMLVRYLDSAGPPALQFAPGPDESVTNSGPITIPEWATSITDGGSAPAAGEVSFVVHTDNDGLFASGPTISADGTLSFTPATGASGSAGVRVYLQDQNGTMSAARTFRIDVSPAPFQNPANPLDANGDGKLSPLDALAVINTVNGQGSGMLVSPAHPFAPGFEYLDTNGDNAVSPLDALQIINELNAEKGAKPTLFGPASLTVGVSSGTVLSNVDQIRLVDDDATGVQTVNLSVAQGTLSYAPSPGQITSATHLTLTGTLAQLNSLLATLVYSSPADGAVTNDLLTVTASDGALNSTPLVVPIAIQNTAPGVMLVAGANNSSTPALTGNIATLNGAVQSLTYTNHVPAGSSVDAVTVTDSNGTLTSNRPIVSVTVIANK